MNCLSVVSKQLNTFHFLYFQRRWRKAKQVTPFKQALLELKNGKEITFVETGGGKSMTGVIDKNDTVTIAPTNYDAVEINDIVLVEWKQKNNCIMHYVFDKKDDSLLIGNINKKMNGWVSKNALKGKVIQIQRNLGNLPENSNN